MASASGYRCRYRSRVLFQPRRIFPPEVNTKSSRWAYPAMKPSTSPAFQAACCASITPRIAVSSARSNASSAQPEPAERPPPDSTSRYPSSRADASSPGNVRAGPDSCSRMGPNGSRFAARLSTRNTGQPSNEVEASSDPRRRVFLGASGHRIRLHGHGGKPTRRATGRAWRRRSREPPERTLRCRRHGRRRSAGSGHGSTVRGTVVWPSRLTKVMSKTSTSAGRMNRSARRTPSSS